uniref:BC027582 protein n=2 Tax=Mus TaxID=862507 RepID=Q8K192_MOUSE|nr:BC027582 protein [Mus musculus]
MYAVQAWCPQRPEEGVGPQELQIQMVVSVMWVLGIESRSPLKEQPIF